MFPDPSAVDPTRRQMVQLLASVLGTGLLRSAAAQPALQVDQPGSTQAGLGPSPLWNAPGPLITLPQKVPLIQLTDRPVQLETPRPYFLSPRTPNAAFFVRWHLPLHPRSVDLGEFRLRIEGHVKQPQALRFSDLLRDFRPQTVVAVNQCAGNSRSRFTPRVPGSQWGNGAMGCAEWTGVRLRDLLNRAGVLPGAVAVQLAALDRGMGPEGYGSSAYLKSLSLSSDMLDEAIVAYAMNGEPLPLLNGFPLRVVVPGYFATYWVKALSGLHVLSAPDENFWMKTAYRIPQTPDGSTTPEAAKSGSVAMTPIGRMPVRSFIVSPMGDGAGKAIRGLPLTVRGRRFPVTIASPASRSRPMMAAPGPLRRWAKIWGATPSARGAFASRPASPVAWSWPCGPPTAEAANGRPTQRSGTPAAICGIGPSGRRCRLATHKAGAPVPFSRGQAMGVLAAVCLLSACPAHGPAGQPPAPQAAAEDAAVSAPVSRRRRRPPSATIVQRWVYCSSRRSSACRTKTRRARSTASASRPQSACPAPRPGRRSPLNRGLTASAVTAPPTSPCSHRCRAQPGRPRSPRCAVPTVPSCPTRRRSALQPFCIRITATNDRRVTARRLKRSASNRSRLLRCCRDRTPAAQGCWPGSVLGGNARRALAGSSLA